MKIEIKLTLMPDEVRIIRSALSRDIINYWKDQSMNTEIDESIKVYKKVAEISDEQYPGWLYPNAELKKILDAS